MEKMLRVRISEADFELVKEAAWLRKVTMSEWTRTVLRATAERTVRESKGTE